MQNCEFAPDNVYVEDYLPSRLKNKCPYCKKEFKAYEELILHFNACPKIPSDAT